jgi:hypothetical protein
VEYGQGINVRLTSGKSETACPLGIGGLTWAKASAVFWEAVSRRVEVTHNVPLVVTQPTDFYMDQVRWRRLGLGQGGWPERQRICVRRLANSRGQGAAERCNRRNHPPGEKTCRQS